MGDGAFAPAVAVAHAVSGGVDDFATADLDDDGDLDVAITYTTAGFVMHQVQWLENTDGLGSFAEAQLLENALYELRMRFVEAAK